MIAIAQLLTTGIAAFVLAALFPSFANSTLPLMSEDDVLPSLGDMSITAQYTNTKKTVTDCLKRKIHGAMEVRLEVAAQLTVQSADCSVFSFFVAKSDIVDGVSIVLAPSGVPPLPSNTEMAIYSEESAEQLNDTAFDFIASGFTFILHSCALDRAALPWGVSRWIVAVSTTGVLSSYTFSVSISSGNWSPLLSIEVSSLNCQIKWHYRQYQR
jgi:hypothetical protein